MTLLVSMTFDCPWGGMETETDRGREKQSDGVQTGCALLSLYVKQISPHGISNMAKKHTNSDPTRSLVTQQMSAQHQNIFQA